MVAKVRKKKKKTRRQAMLPSTRVLSVCYIMVKMQVANEIFIVNKLEKEWRFRETRNRSFFFCIFFGRIYQWDIVGKEWQKNAVNL